MRKIITPPKPCTICKVIYYRGRNSIDQFAKSQFCSSKCRGIWMSQTFTGSKNKNYRGGKTNCSDCGKELAQRYSYRNTFRCKPCWYKFIHGDNHPGWKGENIGYAGIHSWIKKRIPKPDKCDHCGKLGKYVFYKTGQKAWTIQYANKSGDYLRDISDWIFLCSRCHGAYDSA